MPCAQIVSISSVTKNVTKYFEYETEVEKPCKFFRTCREIKSICCREHTEQEVFFC